MLRFLSIQNLAVIDSVEVEFDPGLNVLTGETGAGKSILVEAVGLLLGRPRLARPGADRRGGGDRAGDLRRAGRRRMIVRREVTAQGRSRAFVDGALVTAAALRELPRASSSCTGSTSTRRCSTRRPTSTLLGPFAGAERSAARRRAVCRPARRARASWPAIARASSARAPARASSCSSSSSASSTGSRPRPAKTRSWQRPADAARQRRARRAACADESYGILYDSDEAVARGPGPGLAAVGELAASTARFAPYLEARDAIKSQLEDLASFAPRLRRQHRRLAGAPAGGGGPAGAARAAEAEARPDARRRHRRQRGAPGRARRARARRANALAEGGARAAGARPMLPAGGPRAVGRRAAAAAGRFAARAR